MAEQNSYVTGVGPYPVAPDTSIQAFLSEYEGGEYNNPYRRRLLNSDKPDWIWESDDWHTMRTAYDSWVAQRTNRYNADIKNWETWYNTPLNNSELLDAAGYNRNWLQGAQNSQATAGEPLPIRSAGGADFDPSAGLVNFLSTLQQGMMTFADYEDKMAGVSLKRAQARQIDSMMPYKALMSYLSSAEKGYKMYPEYFTGEKSVFPLDSGMSVSTLPIQDNSIMSSLQELQMEKLALDNLSTKLTTQQKEWIINHANPLQETLNNLQILYMTGQIDMQKVEKEVQQVTADARKEYGSKGIAQQYWLRYVDSAVKLFNTGLDVYKTVRGFGNIEFQQGMDWMKATGEILPGMPGYTD